MIAVQTAWTGPHAGIGALRINQIELTAGDPRNKNQRHLIRRDHKRGVTVRSPTVVARAHPILIVAETGPDRRRVTASGRAVDGM